MLLLVFGSLNRTPSSFLAVVCLFDPQSTISHDLVDIHMIVTGQHQGLATLSLHSFLFQ